MALIRSKEFHVSRWKLLVAQILSLPLLFYFLLIQFTTRVRVVDKYEHERGRRALFYSWHSYNYVFFPFVSHFKFSQLHLLTNQKFVSLLHYNCGWLVRSPVYAIMVGEGYSGREQLRSFFDHDDAYMLIYPDSGGPYYQCKPGSFTVAREVDAEIIPIAAKVNYSISVRFGSYRQIIPMPGATIDVMVGPAFRLNENDQVADMVRKTNQRLNAIFSELDAVTQLNSFD